MCKWEGDGGGDTLIPPIGGHLPSSGKVHSVSTAVIHWSRT